MARSPEGSLRGGPVDRQNGKEAQPASWRVVEHNWAETSVVEANGKRVCLLSIYNEADEENQDVLEKRTTERARLIAAAPDLLAALKALNAAFLGIKIEAPNDRMPAILAASDLARAALAKAST